MAQQGPGQPEGMSLCSDTRQEPAGWLGRQISRLPGLSGKSREFPPGRDKLRKKPEKKVKIGQNLTCRVGEIN